MEKLKFRRQFILGNRAVNELSKWEKLYIGNGLTATIHPDLEFEQYKSGNRIITLLGFIIDPRHPRKSNNDIIHDIGNFVSSFEEMISYSYHLSGRWILIYNDSNETKLLNDVIGVREVYYTLQNGNLWCGTDPSIMNQVLQLNKTKNVELLNYYESNLFRKTENPWFGDKTIYDNVYHLMPNHFLNLKNGLAQRFWIDKEMDYQLENSVEKIGEILKNSIEAANYRYDIMLAITAGLDSRTLLSASKDISEDIIYFVSQMNLGSKHKDIVIPKKLAERFQLKFQVFDNMSSVRSEIKNVLSSNITLNRNHPRNEALQYYYDYHPDKLTINGVISEIGYFYYGENHPNIIGINYISSLINNDYPFVLNEISNWLDEVNNSEYNYSLNVVDLFYWEQRLGNWGSLTRNEQDIANEGFMPFNNRELLMTILHTDKKYRRGGKLNKEIIKYLWPELLEVKINPLSVKEHLFSIGKKILPRAIKQKIRKNI